MTDSSTPAKAKPPAIDPQVRRRRRMPSSVWVIPLVATFLGGTLVFQHYTSQGPSAKITFETAEGIVAGKTEVRCRSVRVGTVEAVSLAEDLKHVVATIRMDLEASGLLNEGSRFWVVRPRLGGGGISGLNTILSGPYIELDPGVSTARKTAFAGLENPPVTPQGIPGIHFTLIADDAGSLSVGSPISFKGIEVGRVESRNFDHDFNKVAFGGFVGAPYDKLIFEDTKFWNTSGLDLRVDANGIQLRTGTIESLFAGGVAFDVPAAVNDQIFPVAAARTPVADGSVFRLYESLRNTNELNLDNCPDYLLLFEDSIRGLQKDAPVEFRGIQVGKVTEISLNYRLLGEDPGKPSVPVFIRIDPMLLRLTDFPPSHTTSPSELLRDRKLMVADAVESGLRASLRIGNYFTGQLYVDLEFDKKDGPKSVERVSKFSVIPTTTTGFARIQESVIAVLEKLDALPVEDALVGVTASFAEIQSAAAALKVAVATVEEMAATLSTFVAADGTQKIPDDLVGTLASLRETLAGFNEQSVVYGDLTKTLAELRETLRSITMVSDTVGRQPNSLIFGRPSSNVEPPRAKPRN